MNLAGRYQIATEMLVAILTSTAHEVSRREAKAKALLHENYDRLGYHDQLRQKAMVLSELAEKVELCGDLPPQLKTLVQERIGSVSFEADRALRLDSVFYMAVLLYPEDYQEGDPNELENLINSLLQ